MADGEGVIVVIPDSGINLRNRVFYRANGESKVLAVWDQTAEYDEAVPNRYGLGRIYYRDDSEDIQVSDPTGHGTGVAAVVAMNAPMSDLVIIKLAGSGKTGFGKASSIMLAVDFGVNLAKSLERPCVVNLSYGNNSGGHDGRNILETYLNHVSESYICSIVTATGNEGVAGHHKELIFEKEAEEEKRAEILIGRGERSLALEVWFSFFDRYEIELRSPGGESAILFEGFDLLVLGNVRVAVYLGEATPLNIRRELRIVWLADMEADGEWTLVFRPTEIRDGRVNMWLPVSDGLVGDTRFAEPDEDITLTIPSTAQGVISVGAYDGNRETLAPFSGRGFTADNRVKPDLAAPGVDVVTSGVNTATGTSYSAPFVSALAAKYMEYGIVQGNAPFLYGEKLKAYLIRRSEEMFETLNYPNPLVGWGVLTDSEI